MGNFLKGKGPRQDNTDGLLQLSELEGETTTRAMLMSSRNIEADELSNGVTRRWRRNESWRISSWLEIPGETALLKMKDADVDKRLDQSRV
jgi:hypothetical protein